MSGIGSLRDVNDISRDIDERLSDIDQGEEAVVTVFTKTAIRIVRVQKNSLKLLRNVEYPQALLGLQRSNFALVANATNYDLIDIENSQQIPLFPISTAGEEEELDEPTTQSSSQPPIPSSGEDEPKSPSPPPEPVKKSTKIRPLIAAVGSDEFLVLSGSGPEEPAMGLVVNTEGNISRGTIPWPQYPESVAVDYPYVASVIGTQIQFHSLHDQSLVQTIQFESVPLISNVSAAISQPYHPLADKIRLVPLVPEGDQSERIEKERKNAEQLSVISSSLFAFSRERGVECLLSSPRIFYLERLVEQEKVDQVVEEMGTLNVSTERDMVELEYLNLLVGVGHLLHEDFSSASGTWQTGTLDPRIVVHIYDAKSVVGDLWVFNGIKLILASVIEKFSAEISVDKTSGKKITGITKKKDAKKNKRVAAKEQIESRQFYQYFLKEWLGKRDMESIVDKKHVFYTIEKAYLSLLLKLDSETAVKKQEVYRFIQHDIIESLEDAILTLEAEKRYYGLFLLYKKRGQTEKVCEIWKRIIVGEAVDADFKGTEKEFAEYLVGSTGQIVWDYGMWLANRNPSAGLQVFTEHEEFSDTELMSAFKKLENQQVWRDFLRILVYVKKDYTFHADLVVVSVEDLQEEIHKSDKNKEFITKGYTKYRNLSLPKRGYIDYMATSPSGNGKDAGGAQKRIVKMRQDLLKLLMQKDVQYDHNVVRLKLEDDKELLQFELCVVYSQMGLRERCIRILCHSLQDFEQSISYCEHGALVLGNSSRRNLQDELDEKASSTTQNELFSILYDETLNLEPETVQTQWTRNLLELHGSQLDLSKVLVRTPESWPVERLSGYLLNVLRHVMKEKNRSTLNRSLARAENIKTVSELRDLKSLKVRAESGNGV